MTRSNLVQHLIDQTGLSRKEARWFVDHFFEAIISGLISHRRVEFRGLGIIKLVERNQVSFHNPKNGEFYPGGKVSTVIFQPSTEIR